MMSVGLRRIVRRHPTLAAPLKGPARALFRFFNDRKYGASEATLQRVAETLAEDPVIRVEEFGGTFEVDVRSGLFRRVVRAGHFEPELTALCRRHLDPARDALDIGANVGFHAVLFAGLVDTGRVVSVEPTARAAARLERNLQRNGVRDAVTIVRAAIADARGTLELKTIEGREEYSTLGALAHPAIEGERYVTERVPTLTLDELVAEHGLTPGFVKVDVEGAEHLVFGGAARTLAEHRPVILSELSDPLLRRNGSSSAEVLAMIAAHGYELIDPLEPGVPAGSHDFADVLCLPR